MVKAGWDVELTGGGHYLLTAPDGYVAHQPATAGNPGAQEKHLRQLLAGKRFAPRSNR